MTITARTRPHRLLRKSLLVAVALGTVVLALWLTLRALTSPARVARTVREKLAREFACHVDVGSAEMGLFSEIVLRDVLLRESPDAEPWASVRELRLRHRTAALMRGKIEVTSAHAIEPRLVIDDATIERLRRLGEKPVGDTTFPATISVERGALQIQKTAVLPGVREIELGSISGHLRTPDRCGRLLNLMVGLELPGGPIAVDAQIDRSQRGARFRAVGSGLQLGKLPRDWLPERVRTRREVRELQGMLSVEADGRVTWGSGEPAVSYAARLRFDDVSFPPEDVSFMVRGLTGDAVVRVGRLSVSNVAGHIGRSRFELDDLKLALNPEGARGALFFRGTVYDVTFDETTRAALPKEAQESWRSLGIMSGFADVEVRFSQQGDATRLGASLDIHELRLRPAAFPYDLPPLDGRVWLSPRGRVHVERLAGRGGGVGVHACRGDGGGGAAGATGFSTSSSHVSLVSLALVVSNFKAPISSIA